MSLLIDPKTVLLLHCDGEDAATAMKDVSGRCHPITFVGTAQLDTAQKKFNNSSLLLDGDSDYLTIPDSNDFHFPADFTIDFWVMFHAGNSYQTLYDKGYAIGAGSMVIQTTNDASPKVGVYTNKSLALTESTGATLDTWYHYALVRNGSDSNNFVLYRDGVNVGQCTETTNISTAYTLGIGGSWLHPLYALNGWIDEVNVVKGKALWTANFTPPKSPYFRKKRIL